MAQAAVETNNRRIYGTFGWAQVGLIGGLLGLAGYGLSLLLSMYIIDPLACRAEALEACGQSEVMASNIAAVVVAVIGAGLLIRLHIHRALGVALAVLTAFWNLGALLQGFAWYEAAAWSVVVYALAYLLFTNLFRIRLLYVAVLLTVVAVVAIRWVAFL